jgi:hypothetical protein
MIDFVRFTLPQQYVKGFENNPDLIGWQHKYKGDGDGSEIARFTNWPNSKSSLLAISIHYPEKTPPYIKIEGSLHYFFNGVKDNSNQFSIQQLKQAIHNLAQKFSFKPSDAVLRCFEFGVNIITPESPRSFLQGLIMHKGTPFLNRSGRKMNFYHCDHSAKVVKCYDKGLQFSAGNILRFEIRYRKMLPVAKYGIKTLADFMVNAKLILLAYELNSTLLELVVFDHGIDATKFPTKIQNELLQGQVYNFWQSISNPNTKKSKLRKFKKLVVDCAGKNILQIHSKLLKNQVNELFKRKDENTLIAPLINGQYGCKTLLPQKREKDCNTPKIDKTNFTQIAHYKGEVRVNPVNESLPEISRQTTTTLSTPKETTISAIPKPAIQSNQSLTDGQNRPLKIKQPDRESLKKFADEAIGKHNHLTQSELLQAIRQAGYNQDADLIGMMLLNGVLQNAHPFTDRFCLGGSTPF